MLCQIICKVKEVENGVITELPHGGGTEWELINYVSSSHYTYNISDSNRYYYYIEFVADLSPYKQLMVVTQNGNNEILKSTIAPKVSDISLTEMIIRANTYDGSSLYIGQAWYEGSGRYRIDAIDPSHSKPNIIAKLYGKK